MANTINVFQTTVSNTFNQWRINDNLMANDVNEICRGDFVKPFGNVVISEGYVRIANSSGGVILDVKDDTNIDGTLTVFNIEVDNSTNHLYVDAGDIQFRRMGATDLFKVNTNTIFYGANITFSNATHGTINANVQTVRINIADTMNINYTGSASATLNVHPNTYIFANVNVTGTLNVTNNVFAYNLNVASNTATGNLIVRQLANIDNANITTAYVRTLTVEDPILAPAVTDGDKYVLRFSSAAGGDGYFRVRRGQGAGTANADLHWNETTGAWNIEYNNLPANVVMGNITANFKSTRDFINSTTTGGSVTVNLNEGNWFKYTLNAPTTFTFTNAPSNGLAITFSLILIQDGSGGRTLSFANTVYWSGGTIPPPTYGASSKDLWTFTSYDGGSTYVGTLAVKDFR
jgi:hypothetical protein